MKIELFNHPAIKGLYLTSDGRVFTERPVHTGAQGYAMVRLESHKAKQVRRAVLVAETFYGPRPEGHEVQHKNGDRADDRPSNLRWGTRAENYADRVRHGRAGGGRGHYSVLNESQVREIRKRVADGESSRYLAQEFGVKPSTICSLVKRESWAWVK